MAGTSKGTEKVVVAMSGGVDSSVAAAILAQEGYDVIGVTMQIWPSSDGIEDQFSRTCCSLSAVEDARRVASRIGIPHYVMNFKELFQKTVIDDFIEQYRRGRTPNPCVRCNKFVKFESLLAKALAMGADYVATGHYSRIVFDDERGRWILRRGLDHSKDQSYALYGMSQHQLAHTLLPLGGIAKDETRKMASELGLAVADKPDSQEICFVENRDYPSFLKATAPEVVKPGPILDMSGSTIGEHNGIAFYTIGQRKRIGIAAPAPLYVVRIDSSRNAIVVGSDQDLYASGLVANELNFVSISDLTTPIAVTAKIRYNMRDSSALLCPMADKQARLVFDQPQRAITPGQAAVFYSADDVVGGGTIDRVEE
jgi:tRNA-specific 2-thiouridylase